MSKFCNYCGTQLDDSATFCANCGAQIEAGSNAAKATKASAPQSTPTHTSNVQLDAPAKGDGFIAQNKNKLIGAGIAVVAVILIFSIVSSIISGWGYKGPIKNYYKAVNKESGKTYMKTKPEFICEAEDKDEDDYDDLMEEELESIGDIVGKNPKIEYEILEKTEIPEKRLENLTDSYNEIYEDELDDECEITDGYEVLLKVTCKGSREKKESYDVVTVLKIDGDWYIG